MAFDFWVSWSDNNLYKQLKLQFSFQKTQLFLLLTIIHLIKNKPKRNYAFGNAGVKPELEHCFIDRSLMC